MKALENLMDKKKLAGLVLLVSSSVVGIPACGDDCAAGYKTPKNGAYVSKEYGSQPESPGYNANDNGCPPGCSSSSDTCCYCPD